MQTSKVLILGAIVGAAVVWLWGREVAEYVGEQARGVRTTAAEGIQAVEGTAGKVLDLGGDALRRAGDALQDTREDVRGALRTAQDAIRP